MKPGNTGLKRLFRATIYSWQGLCAAFAHEAAFRQELFMALIIVPLAIWLTQNTTQLILLLGGWFLVLICELLNSAIEAVVDRIGDDYHDLSARAKDIGSAAVFMALLYNALIWGVMFYQNLGRGG